MFKAFQKNSFLFLNRCHLQFRSYSWKSFFSDLFSHCDKGESLSCPLSNSADNSKGFEHEIRSHNFQPSEHHQTDDEDEEDEEEDESKVVAIFDFKPHGDNQVQLNKGNV